MDRKNTEWWKDAKFGMFIHWGIYSLLAGKWKNQLVKGNSEWIMKRLSIPRTEYENVAKNFNPIDFNAEEWVCAAKAAGMKYLVITAKHHDGFAMFKSCDPYNIVDSSPFGRDPIKDLSKECRKEGIKLCFYYSHVLDWHEPDAFSDDIIVSDLGKIKEQNESFRNYLEKKVKPQIRELLTNYGEIGVMWFDMPSCVDINYCQEIYNLVKKLQPNCLVSGRIGYGLGDFITVGDNKLPRNSSSSLWEMPGTINGTWGFKEGDTNWKSPKEILTNLTKIVSRGGNYLLNIGPDGNGRIPEKSTQILKEVGTYLKKYGESIYKSTVLPEYPYDLEEGVFTFKNGIMYFHCLNPQERLTISCISNKIEKVWLLNSHTKVNYEVTYSEAAGTHELVIEWPPECKGRQINVFGIKIEGTPKFDSIL